MSDSKEWVTIKIPKTTKKTAKDDPRTYEEIMQAGLGEPIDYETESFDIDGVSIDVTDLRENFESVELVGATPNEDLRELIEEWRDKGDTLIHEGENEYIEGRGGQLAQCARELEAVLEE